MLHSPGSLNITPVLEAMTQGLCCKWQHTRVAFISHIRLSVFRSQGSCNPVSSPRLLSSGFEGFARFPLYSITRNLAWVHLSLGLSASCSLGRWLMGWIPGSRVSSVHRARQPHPYGVLRKGTARCSSLFTSLGGLEAAGSQGKILGIWLM